MRAFLILVTSVLVAGTHRHPRRSGARRPRSAEPRPPTTSCSAGTSRTETRSTTRSPPIRRRLRWRLSRRNFARNSQPCTRGRIVRARHSTPPKRHSSAIPPTARRIRIIGTVYAALSEQRRPFRPGDDPAQYGATAIAALEKSRRDAGFDVNLELMLGRLVSGRARLSQGDRQPAKGRRRSARNTRKGPCCWRPRRKAPARQTTRFERSKRRSRTIRRSTARHCGSRSSTNKSGDSLMRPTRTRARPLPTAGSMSRAQRAAALINAGKGR